MVWLRLRYVHTVSVYLRHKDGATDFGLGAGRGEAKGRAFGAMTTLEGTGFCFVFEYIFYSANWAPLKNNRLNLVSFSVLDKGQVTLGPLNI